MHEKQDVDYQMLPNSLACDMLTFQWRITGRGTDTLILTSDRSQESEQECKRERERGREKRGREGGIESNAQRGVLGRGLKQQHGADCRKEGQA